MDDTAKLFEKLLKIAKKEGIASFTIEHEGFKCAVSGVPREQPKKAKQEQPERSVEESYWAP